MSKQINCGICALNGDTIAMTLTSCYFKCPQCGAELYDNDQGDDTFIKNWRQQQQHISRSLPEGVQIHGGEKKQGKSSLQGKMKKDSVSRLNSLLCKDH